MERIRKLLRNKRIVVFGAALLALLVAREIRLNDPPFVAALRSFTFDSYQRLKPRVPLGQPIRVIDIDEASIAEFGQWPWPRTRLAAMLDRLGSLGVAVVAFDMAFSEPDRTGAVGFAALLRERNVPGREAIEAQIASIPDNDAVFAEAIARVPTVLGFFSEPNSKAGLPEIKAGFSYAGSDPAAVLAPIRSSVMSLPQLRAAAAGGGTITLGQQSEDVVRRVPMFMANGKRKFPAFALETLRLAQGASTYVLKTSSASGQIAAGKEAMTEFKVGQFRVPVTAGGELLLYYARNDPALYLPARDLLARPDDELRPLLEGHIVFVGASASGLRDIRHTALGENVPGVYMHVQIADQILSGTYLERPDWAEGAELMAMAATTVLIVAILPFTGALVSSIVGLLVAAGTLAGSWYAFSRHGLLLDPVFPMLTGAAIFLLTTLLLFAVTEREKRFVRSAFQRYVAPELLHKLEADPESLKLGGEMRDMTLMFMDIRGFTPISERLGAEPLVAFLNKLLAPLSEAILRHEGTIDKYIGDSIMAFWNAPLPVERHPMKAARAALAMQGVLAEMNAADAFGFHTPQIGLGDAQIGIGINTGMACVGNMGSVERFDYSVIGDTVNVAARIESSCKTVGWGILLSEAAAVQCPGFALLEAGSIALKGKSRPAKLFALIGDEGLAGTDGWRTLSTMHGELVADLDAGRHSDAEAKAARCTAAAPLDLREFYDRLLENYGVASRQAAPTGH
jgi:adenylate cyclase